MAVFDITFIHATLKHCQFTNSPSYIVIAIIIYPPASKLFEGIWESTCPSVHISRKLNSSKKGWTSQKNY